MRNFARASVDWLRRLFVEAEVEDPSHAGSVRRASLGAALVHTEASLADALCHSSRPTQSPEHRRRQTQGSPTLNAFGSPLLEIDAGGARGALASAVGLALTGQRAAVFVNGGHLAQVAPQFREVSRRDTPLVMHTRLEDHAGYHALSSSGAFLALAGSAQEALDLTLVARRLSELALLPGVVATDAERLGDLRLPDAALIREYLGAPREAIPSASPAQRSLFGDTRRRAPLWFDATRPMSTGVRLSPAERVLAARARAHSATPLASLARQAREELSALTGRELPCVRSGGAEGARWVVVAQGGAAETAHAVASRLQATEQLPCGSVAVTWLRPFPTEALRAALAQAEGVTVLERLGDAPNDAAPLLSELRSRLDLSKVRWVSAGYSGAISAADMRALFSNMQASEPRTLVHLHETPPPTAFPKRQALVEAFAASAPEVSAEATGPSDEFEFTPAVRVVALVGAVAHLSPHPLEDLARAFEDQVETPCMQGVELTSTPGLWHGRLALSAETLPAPAESSPVDLLLVATRSEWGAGSDPFAGMRRGGQVVLAVGEGPSSAWEGLPMPWRERIAALDLALYAIPAASAPLARAEELLAFGASLLAGEAHPKSRVVPNAAGSEPERRPPALIRRGAEVRTTPDSASRFYGEVFQPRQAEGVGAADPYLAAALVPALTSAFVDVSAKHALLPVLDTERCTGCGVCWSACPDSAIGAGALEPLAALDAAADAAGTQGTAAGALRRAHKHLAGRIASRLQAGEAFGEELLRESFAWLLERMSVADDARADTEAAFEATLRHLLSVPSVACEAFFGAPESECKGSGQILHLAIDPRTCQSCGLCSAACPEDALTPTHKTPELSALLRAGWEAHEGRPEPASAAFERLATSEHVGLMAALLASKHYAQALVGGGGTEPGSGERLATRLVCALAEHHTQTHMASWISDLDRLEAALKQRLRGLFRDSLEDVEASAFAKVLSGEAGPRIALAELSLGLGDQGKHPNLDREAALQLAQAAQDVARCRWELREGESGLGRARFGVVLSGGVAEWAGTFPESPFYAPLTVELTDEGVDLARGCAEGLLAEFTALVRVRRRATLLCEAPSDLPAQLANLDRITWRDLDPGERAACPPLLLVGDDGALSERGLGRLSRLLSSDLPLKVVLLDGLGRLDAHANPTLVAMAHRRAFVVSASVAEPDPLARGLRRAMAYSGPALIHVHAPSPRAHGFSPTETLERARLAVLARAHPLVVYDPSAEGAFGICATLADNPAPRDAWARDAEGAPFTFADWAAGEERFAGEFSPLADSTGSPMPMVEYLALPESRRRGKVPWVGSGAQRRVPSPAMVRAAEDRLHLWTSLQEVCGVASPFVDRVREELRAELQAEAQAQIQAAEMACDERIRQADLNLEQELKARLHHRLTALASQQRSG
jgi:pyruvate-ferredoxin/flavodoxin oxidoreductase